MSCDLFDPISGEVLEAESDGARSSGPRQAEGQNGGRGTPGERIRNGFRRLLLLQRVARAFGSGSYPTETAPAGGDQSLRQYSGEEGSASKCQWGNDRAPSSPQSEGMQPQSSSGSPDQEAAELCESEGPDVSSPSGKSDEDDSDQSDEPDESVESDDSDESEQMGQTEPSELTDASRSISQSSNGVFVMHPKYQCWAPEQAPQMLRDFNMPYGMMPNIGFHPEAGCNQGVGATGSHSPTIPTSPTGLPSAFGSYGFPTYQPCDAAWQQPTEQSVAIHAMHQATHWYGQPGYAPTLNPNTGYFNGGIPAAFPTTQMVRQHGTVEHAVPLYGSWPLQYSAGSVPNTPQKAGQCGPLPQDEQKNICPHLKRSASEGSIGRRAAPVRSRSAKDLARKGNAATLPPRRSRDAVESVVERSKSSFFLRRPSFYVKKGGRHFKGCLVVGKKQRTSDEDDDEDDDALTPLAHHPEPPFTDVAQVEVHIPASLDENTQQSSPQAMEMVGPPHGRSTSGKAQAAMETMVSSFVESMESGECSSSSEGECCSTYSEIWSSVSSGFGGKRRSNGSKGGTLPVQMGAEGEEGNQSRGWSGGGTEAVVRPRCDPLGARSPGDVFGKTSQEPQENETERARSNSKGGHELPCQESDCEMRGEDCRVTGVPEVVAQEAMGRLAGQLGRLPEALLDSVIVHLLATLEPDTWPAVAGCDVDEGRQSLRV